MRNILKGLVLITIILLSTAIELNAVPAKPGPVKYKLPDGTTIEIVLKGDEKVRWAETMDGYSILLNKDGFYEYAALNEKGDMVRSGVRAYNASQRPSAHKSTLEGVQKKLHFSKSQVSMMKQIWQIKEKEAAKASKAFPTTGSRKLICILIGYTDLSFSKTQTDFNNLFNQVGYSAGSATGSVKDYYLENSYDQFNLTVDVAGPYTASNTMSYYGTNSPSDDYRVRTLVSEAVNLADADVNFSDYDNDNNGDVDGLYIIYAGYGEEAGASSDAIWAHAWAITPVTKDGVSISRYSCSAELSGSSGSTITGIGVICHEFGHVLGAPDYYDTDYSTDGQYQGTGEWDMMAGGSWNNNGNTPAHHNIFTKWYYYNWLTPTTLSSATTVTLNNSVDNAEAYLINTASTNEYFLLENRQQTGFDAAIPGHGLLIYRVDQDNVDSHDGSNDINATHPQYMYPVAQNNSNSIPSGTTSYGTINSSTCPWNGSGKTEFTDASTPSMKSWSGSNTNKPITDIAESSGVITFDFMGGAQGNPTSFTATANGESQIDLSWTRDASRDVLLVYNTTNTFGTPTDGVNYSVGNDVNGTGIVLYAGANETYSHTALTANTTYYYKIFTKLNSTPDWSDGTTTSATTDCGTISSFPFTEDFSGGSLPSCWSNDDNDGSGQVWEFDNPGGRTFSSSSNANGFAILDSDNYGNGGSQDADLVSPTFDFSSATEVTLEFDHYFRSYSGSAAELSYSINGGSSWTQIQQWSSSTSNAATFSQVIAAVAGESSVKFKWNYVGSWGYYWCVDDVSISVSTSSPDPEPANYPTSFTDASTTSSSITLTWTDAASKAPAGYLIKGSTISYADIDAPVDGTPEADAALVKNIPQGTQTVEFTGLTASTTYYFEIYPYTNSGATIDYKTDGTIPTVSVTTTSTGYYDGITGTGYTLKTNLYNLIDGHTSRTYDQLWTDMQSTDNDGVYENDNTVLDMYGENPSGADPFNFTWVSGQCGTYGGEGDCYNREHSMPASWFSDASPMYTDLFHLYPTDGYVNGIRGNLPFGEVGTANYTSDNGSLRGSCSYPGYTGTVFEPIDEFKGDFARTYFYMATRYENVIAGWETNTTESDAALNGTSDQVFENWFLSMLIEWHQNDPVSLKETNRNEAVYGIQGNRNPFIDHPEWVCQIWSSFCGPNIAASPASLTGFTYEEGAGPSTSQSFELSGTNLDGSQVTVTAPTNYEVSTDNSSFSTSVNVSYSGSSLSSTTIYVRLKAGLSIATYNGENVTCNDNGSASDVTVSNSGEVTAVGGGGGCASDLIISEVDENGGDKYVEIFNNTGAGVALGDYEIKVYANGNTSPNSTISLTSTTLADGDTWVLGASTLSGVTDQTSGSFTPNGNDVVALSKNTTNIDVFGTIGSSSYFNDDQTAIRNSSITSPTTTYDAGEWTFSAYGGGDPGTLGLHTMDCGGSTPTITLSTSTLTGFTYEVGAGPSAEQSFTVEGSDLTDDITLTAPTNYEISTGTGGSFVATSPLTLTESGGSVSTTTIYVRLKSGLSEGDYNSEDITVASTGATSETVTCSGNVSNRPDWCNLQSPANGTITESGEFLVYAQVYEPGVTEAAGQGAGVTCWIGYNATDTDPSTWTNWVVATYNVDDGNNDEYVADIGSALPAGTYYYASRFSVDGTNYSYGGYSAGGGHFWDGSTYVSGTITVNTNYPDWCNLQWPDNGSITLGDAYDVYARVYEPGVTDAAGQGAGVTAWIGYNTADTDPSTWTDWVAATYNVDDGNNDEYMADLGAEIASAGTYYYASRFSVNGTDYSYGGYNTGGGDGFWDGTDDVSGVLTVNAPASTCEDFDDQSGSSYVTSFTTDDFGNWTASQAGNFNLGIPRNGASCVAINDDKTGAHITTPSFNTVGTVTFWYYERSGGDPDEFELQISESGGAFTTVDIQNYDVGTTYTEYSFDVNSSDSDVKIRVLNDNQSAHLIIDDFCVTSYSSGPIPDITIADNGTQVAPASDIAVSTLNLVLHKSQISVATADATLSGITCTTSGTYQASDIDNLEVYYSTDDTWDGADTRLSTQSSPSTAGVQTFPSFTSQVISSGSTGYIFIIADISSTAAGGRTINVDALTTGDYSFSSANKLGSTTAGGTQTFYDATVVLAQNGSVSAGNVAPGQTNVLLTSWSLSSSAGNTTLNEAGMTVQGTYVAADIATNGFKLWSSTTNDFSGAVQVGSSISAPGDGTQFIDFSGLSVAVNQGTLVYFWFTVDISASATPGNTINRSWTLASDMTFADNVKCTGSYDPEGVQTITEASITLADNGTQVAAADVNQAAQKHTLHTFQLTVADVSTELSQVDFTSAGTYAAADVNKFQLWYHTADDLSAATQLGSDITTTLGAGTHSFSGLSQSLSIGTGYFWVTTDINASATLGNTISANAIATTDLTFVSGSKSGSTTAGGAQTIIELPYCSDLMISEYMEGDGNNTAIELFNGTGGTLILTGYELRRKVNNAGDWVDPLALTGSVPHGEIYLIVDEDGTDLINYLNTEGVEIDMLVPNTTQTLKVSGNDPIALFYEDGTKVLSMVDVVGDGTNFQEVNLKRNANVFAPNTTFTLSEWTEVSPFSFTDLGDTDNPLPVTWSDVSAKASNGSVLVEWSTHSEINNDYFEIEHSLNNIDFNMVGIVDGAGNSAVLQEYSYLHSGAVLGNNYYRIKQIDFDGAYDYSRVVTANLAHNEDSKLNIEYVFVGKNKQQVLVNYQSNERIKVEIYDITGQIVYASDLLMTSDYQYIDLSEYTFKEGMFIITVKGNDQLASEKFIVK